jgi:hypothetical protein
VDITLANAQIEEHDNGLSVIEKLAYMPLLFPGVSMCLKCSRRSQENFKHTDVEKDNGLDGPSSLPGNTTLPTYFDWVLPLPSTS